MNDRKRRNKIRKGSGIFLSSEYKCGFLAFKIPTRTLWKGGEEKKNTKPLYMVDWVYAIVIFVAGWASGFYYSYRLQNTSHDLVPIEAKEPVEEVREIQNEVVELERKLKKELAEKSNLKAEFLEALEELEGSINGLYTSVGLSKKAKDELAYIDKPKFGTSVFKHIANSMVFGSGSVTVATVKKIKRWRKGKEVNVVFQNEADKWNHLKRQLLYFRYFYGAQLTEKEKEIVAEVTSDSDIGGYITSSIATVIGKEYGESEVGKKLRKSLREGGNEEGISSKITEWLSPE